MTNDERSRLDVIEAKVDTILLKLEYVEGRAKDHEDRIRKNEQFRFALPVATILAGASFATAITAAIIQAVAG